MGTNGATPTSYDDLLDAIYELELDNSAPPTAAVWHPRTARTYRKMKDSTGQPLRAPEPVNSLPKLSTTSVPINQTQGTATGVCSTVLMGDFTQAILGMREGLNITLLRERFADTGQLAFVAHIRADVAFAHPESFVKLLGVKP
jgi:HK97 family phage major capsid protein